MGTYPCTAHRAFPLGRLVAERCKVGTANPALSVNPCHVPSVTAWASAIRFVMGRQGEHLIPILLTEVLIPDPCAHPTHMPMQEGDAPVNAIAGMMGSAIQNEGVLHPEVQCVVA